VLLKHARDFSQSAQELGGTLSGDIHVGAFLTLAVRFMPALLARFARLEPRIAISLQEGDHFRPTWWSRPRTRWRAAVA